MSEYMQLEELDGHGGSRSFKWEVGSPLARDLVARLTTFSVQRLYHAVTPQGTPYRSVSEQRGYIKNYFDRLRNLAAMSDKVLTIKPNWQPAFEWKIGTPPPANLKAADLGPATIDGIYHAACELADNSLSTMQKRDWVEAYFRQLSRINESSPLDGKDGNVTIKTVDSEAARLKRELDSAKAALVAREKDLEMTRGLLDGARADLKNYQASCIKFREERDELSGSALAKRMAQLQNSLDCAKADADAERASATSALKALQADFDSISERNSNLVARNDEMSAELKKAKSAALTHAKAYVSVKNDLDLIKADNAELCKQNKKLASDNKLLQLFNAKTPEKTTMIDIAQEAPQPQNTAPAAKTFKDMLVEAGVLAVIQETSTKAVSTMTPMLVSAGLPKELAEHEQFQKLMALMLPAVLSKYAHHIPGVQNVPNIDRLAEQQLILGLANLMGVSIRELMGMGTELVKSLAAGADDLKVEQLND